MDLTNSDTNQKEVSPAATSPKEIETSVKEELLPVVGRCGLMNNGNTCYLNTGIQVSVCSGFKSLYSVCPIFLTL